MKSICNKCGAIVNDIDAGFSPAATGENGDETMKTGLKLKIEIWVVNRHGWLADYKPATLWIRWNNRIIGINKNGIQR